MRLCSISVELIIIMTGGVSQKRKRLPQGTPVGQIRMNTNGRCVLCQDEHVFTTPHLGQQPGKIAGSFRF